MFKKHKRIILSYILVILITVIQPMSIFGEDLTGDVSLEYLKSVMNMIKQKYNGQVTDQQLVEGALKGMFNTMDPYTTYYTNEEANSFFGEMEGSYEGIGIVMEKNGEYIKAIDVIKGSPAENAGMLVGDIIVEVDGKDIKGMEVTEVGSMIKGESGTFVILGVIRENVTVTMSFKVKRGTVKLDPGTYNIENGIGYIKLYMFSSGAADFINRALNDMDRKGVEKLILDLRDNPGGEVSQAVDIARNFVPKGLIARLDFKDPSKDDMPFYSLLEKPRYKLVVLVNENSASASEIVAGAIQDTNAGTLIGTKTFGKARVQSIIPILTPEAYKKYEDTVGSRFVDAYDLYLKYGIEPKDDEIMGWSKITTGEYYTPKGRMIDKKGLVPDIEISNLSYDGDIDISKIRKFASSGKDAGNPSSSDVYNAEMVLNLLGFFRLNPDEVYDEDTEAAVKSFQKSIKAEQNGLLDDTTRVVLNKKITSIYNLIDRQYIKAVEILNKN